MTYRFRTTNFGEVKLGSHFAFPKGSVYNTSHIYVKTGGSSAKYLERIGSTTRTIIGEYMGISRQQAVEEVNLDDIPF